MVSRRYGERERHPDMSGYFKLCNALYWIALTLWISSLITAGIAAMNVFGQLIGMPMQLDQFAAVPREEHGRLAAGIVMERVFFTIDLVQFLAVPLTVITLLLQLFVFRMRWTAASNILRTLCILLAAGIFAYHATSLAPVMNRDLRQYWSAAEAGDLAQADAHRSAFNQKHVIADNLLRANILFLLLGIGASAFAFTPSNQATTSRLEQPHLLNRQ